MIKPAILLIATNKYKSFIDPLLESIDKYFFTDREITVHLFTDDFAGESTERVKVERYLIQSYKFPEATLFRYKIFKDHQNLLTEDFLLYLDIDSLLVNPIGEEILSQGITAVSHPGFFYNNSWGSQNVNPESTAYLPKEKWLRYYCGGTQGGSRDTYLEACNRLAYNISVDEARSILAEHNDESHWNHYLNSGEYIGELKVLDPSYCMVENSRQRNLWKIDHLTPRILCLDKNHKEIRA